MKQGKVSEEEDVQQRISPRFASSILDAGWSDQVGVCRLPSTVYRLLMARRLSITATDCK